MIDRYRGGPVHVEANMGLDVDGNSVLLTANGDRLSLHAQSPIGLLNAISNAALPAGFGAVNGRRAIGRLGDALDTLGLHLDVSGPHGVLVRLGGGGSSLTGRLLTGSSRVQFGSMRAVLPVARHWIRTARPTATTTLTAAGTVGVTLLVGRLIRRWREASPA